MSEFLSFGSLTYTMPYMFRMQADTSCTFLLMVNNELREVAKGKIVSPLVRMMHGKDMPADVFKVQVERFIKGYENQEIPIQPEEGIAYTLGRVKTWVL